MSRMPSNWRAIVARDRDNPINRRPPTRFPYIDELMRDPSVRSALDLAWKNTNADIIPVTAGVEQGGWIYMHLRSGQLTIVHQTNTLTPPLRPGENQQGAFNVPLHPCNPPAGSVLVAYFHTHPSVPFTGASQTDRDIGRLDGIPGIVRGREGAVDFTGPERRAGEFRNANQHPGFPP